MVAPPKNWLNDQLRDYLGKLLLTYQKQIDPNQMPVTVEHNNRFDSSEIFDSDGFEGHTTASFFTAMKSSFVLLGEPGSGKSYSLRSHALWTARWLLWNAEELHEYQDDLPYVVPVLIDMKSYQGDLRNRFAYLERSIGLKELIENRRVEFLIDSFNEARNEFRASGLLQQELQDCMEKTQGCRWIITSRSEDGLEFFKATRFRLSLLKQSFVDSLAKIQQLNFGHRYRLELKRLLRRPFFLSAFLNERLEIPDGGMHPAKAIEQILSSFEGELGILLRIKPRLANAFGPLAQKSIATSNEIVPIDDLVNAIQTTHEWPKPLAEKAIEKLIELGLFQSIDSERAAFYHQSITEMLAAKTISQQAEQRPEVLEQVLSAPCWDGVLNLLPYYLSEAVADALLDRLQNSQDYSLATKFMRGFASYQSSIVTRYLDRLLLAMPNVPSDGYQSFYMSLRHMPVEPEHVPQLKQLTKCRDARSQGSMRALFQLVLRHHEHPLGDYPELELDNAIQWYLDGFETEPDWGCYEPGSTLEGMLPIKYFERILDMCQSHVHDPKLPDHDCQLARALGYGFNHIPAKEISALLRKYPNPSLAVLIAVTYWADTSEDDDNTLDLLFQLILMGHTPAVFDLYLKFRYSSNKLHFMRIIKHCPPEKFARFVEQIRRKLLGEGGDSAVEFIALICKFNRKMQANRDRWIKELTVPYGLALLASDDQRSDEFWQRLHQFAMSPHSPLTDFEYDVLEYLRDKDVQRKLNWDAHGEVLIALLQRGDLHLVRSLFEGLKLKKVQIEWSQLELYLSLPLEDIFKQSISSEFAVDKSLQFFAQNISTECRSRVLQEVNDPNSKFREAIIGFFLPRYWHINLSDFSSETIQTIIQRLHRVTLNSSQHDPLPNILKTKDEVTAVLGPYFSVQDEPFRSNLRLILNSFGKHFACRFGI